jgi:hypothetical protein
VAGQQLAQVGGDLRLDPEGAQVVGQGPVGVAGRGRVLEAAGLVRARMAALDAGLGGRLEGDRPLGQGEQGVPPRRVRPRPPGQGGTQDGQPLAPRRPGTAPPAGWILTWPR